MTEIRAKHAEGGKWFGVEAKEGKVKDMYKENVLEPLSVKEQIVKVGHRGRLHDTAHRRRHRRRQVEGSVWSARRSGGMGGGDGEFD